MNFLKAILVKWVPIYSFFSENLARLTPEPAEASSRRTSIGMVFSLITIAIWSYSDPELVL